VSTWSVNPNLGALPILTLVSLTHIPSLFACFHEYVRCFVLITRGWERLETRPPVALGSSPELFVFDVASSPGSRLPHLLDGHRKLVGSSVNLVRSCPGPVRYHWGSIVELEVPPDERQDWRHSTPTTPTYYKSSHMLNHHTHPKDPIRDQKPYAFDTSMASPSRQHNFAVRVSHRYIVTVAEFGRYRRVWALPQSLGDPAEFRRSHQRRTWNPLYRFEFRRSHRIWALPNHRVCLRQVCSMKTKKIHTNK